MRIAFRNSFFMKTMTSNWHSYVIRFHIIRFSFTFLYFHFGITSTNNIITSIIHPSNRPIPMAIQWTEQQTDEKSTLLHGEIYRNGRDQSLSCKHHKCVCFCTGKGKENRWMVPSRKCFQIKIIFSWGRRTHDRPRKLYLFRVCNSESSQVCVCVCGSNVSCWHRRRRVDWSSS